MKRRKKYNVKNKCKNFNNLNTSLCFANLILPNNQDALGRHEREFETQWSSRVRNTIKGLREIVTSDGVWVITIDKHHFIWLIDS